MGPTLGSRVALALLLGCLGCAGDREEVTAPGSRDPAALEIVSGDAQSALAGQRLEQPLIGRLVARDGDPVADVEVRWSAERGGGLVTPEVTRTDAEGLASTRRTLGPQPGIQQVEGVASAGTIEPVTFTAVAHVPESGDVLGKIDPPLRARLDRPGTLPVIALGSDQLLLGSGAFEAFVAGHGGASRSALRQSVIRNLKGLADGQRDELLGVLGDPDGASGWWVINAVFAHVTGAQVKRASRSQAVARLYLADGPPTMMNGSGSLAAVLTPSSPSRFTTDGKVVPWNLDRIGARRVWEELGVVGEGVVVAVIDSGTDYLHSDLRDNVWINEGEVPENGLDDDGNGFIDDYYGYNVRVGGPRVRLPGGSHGTYTAGIVAGDGSGGIVTGVAPRARIQVLIFSSTLNHATNLQYALENGADVATMSFSQPNKGNLRALWRLMADHATAAGLVQVSGAGNFRLSAQVPDQLRMPEAIPSVMAVGGVDRQLEVAPFSSTGPVDWSEVHFYEDLPNLTKPDVAGFSGPGYPLLAPFTTGYVDPNPSIGGNSFSGPHAAGVAALVLSANPELPAWEVREIVESTAEDLAPSGKDNDTGWGLVNAWAAVQEARRR